VIVPARVVEGYAGGIAQCMTPPLSLLLHSSTDSSISHSTSSANPDAADIKDAAGAEYSRKALVSQLKSAAAAGFASVKVPSGNVQFADAFTGKEVIADSPGISLPLTVSFKVVVASGAPGLERITALAAHVETFEYQLKPFLLSVRPRMMHANGGTEMHLAVLNHQSHRHQLLSLRFGSVLAGSFTNSVPLSPAFSHPNLASPTTSLLAISPPMAPGTYSLELAMNSQDYVVSKACAWVMPVLRLGALSTVPEPDGRVTLSIHYVAAPPTLHLSHHVAAELQSSGATHQGVSIQLATAAIEEWSLTSSPTITMVSLHVCTPEEQVNITALEGATTSGTLPSFVYWCGSLSTHLYALGSFQSGSAVLRVRHVNLNVTEPILTQQPGAALRLSYTPNVLVDDHEGIGWTFQAFIENGTALTWHNTSMDSWHSVAAEWNSRFIESPQPKVYAPVPSEAGAALDLVQATQAEAARDKAFGSEMAAAALKAIVEAHDMEGLAEQVRRLAEATPDDEEPTVLSEIGGPCE
jgi:hypothetical protein